MALLIAFIREQSLLTKMDPRVKILVALFFLYSTYALVSSLVEMVLILATALLLAVLSRGGWRTYGKPTKILFFISLLVVFLQSISYQGIVNLFMPAPPSIKVSDLFTLAGFIRGLTFAIRFGSISIAFLALVLTTTPEDITLMFYKLGVPFKYSYLPSLVLRFLPVMEKEVREITQAQACRGHEMEKGGVLQRFRNLLHMVIPAMISIFRRSTDMTIALEMRGYSSNSRRTFLRDLTMRKVDYLLVLSVIIVTILLLVGRIEGI